VSACGLEGQRLEEVRLEEVRLEEVRLEEVRLEEVRLEEVRLEGQRLEEMRLGGLKKEWSILERFLVEGAGVGMVGTAREEEYGSSRCESTE